MSSAAIYCRISRDPGHDELGVRRQEKDCRELCAKHNLDVLEVIVDDDRSAYRGKRRLGYEQLRQLLKDGAIKVVVAWHPDRLTRHPRELEDLIDLLEASHATVRTVQAGEYDLGTPSGRMTARVVGAVARHESEHKSERLRRKHVELAEAGKVSGGGDRPFGYNADRRTINHLEARAVRTIAKRALAGQSTRSLAVGLNRLGIPTAAGKPWTTIAVRRVLLSPRIAGLRAHRGEVVSKAEWPAIITAEQHRRLVALLADPSRRVNRAPRSYLLTGLARCGLCGAKLVARPRSDKRRCYVCATGPGSSGCGRIRTLADPIEELVATAVIARLDSPALAAALTSSDEGDDLAAALEAVDARLAELGEMWAAGEIDRVGWSAARRRLEAERGKLAGGDQLRERCGRPRALQPPTRSPQRRLAQPRLGQRRAIVVPVVETVTVGPAVRGRNVFDPSRVSVEWRV